VSHSATRNDSYRDGWRALNRLIHEGGSLSGHETNVFYVNCGDGTFSDASSVAGLDSDLDARAFAVADLDHDGDLDLVLKNRNGPQVRVLRNEMGNANPAVAFELGPRAAGTRVTIETLRGTRSKTLQLGSGFLSQSSSRIWFGLGEETEIQSVRVDWASGASSEFANLRGGQMYSLRPGRSDPRATSLLPQPPLQPAPLPEPVSKAHARERASEDPGTWILQPPPAPDFRLTSLDGKQYQLRQDRRAPVLINFWATWCPPCRKELGDFAKAYPRLKARGVELMAVSLDGSEQQHSVEQFAAEQRLPFPVMIANDNLVAAYSLVYRQLFGGRRELPLPMTLLIDRDGAIARVYVGPVEADRLQADLDALPEARRNSLRAATPFDGRWHGLLPGRDLTAAADAFLAAGLPEPARLYYETILQQGELSAPSWNNLALARGATGREKEAEAALRRAVAIDDRFAEAWQNLGIVLLRSGRPKDALQALKRAVSLQLETHALYHHLGLAYGAENHADESVEAFRTAHRLNSQAPETLLELAALYLQRDLGRDALFVLKKAAELNTAGKMNEAEKALFRDLVSAANRQVGISSEPAGDSSDPPRASP
jgi:peroxiredoxin